LQRLRAGGQRVLDLTASNPTMCGLPYSSEAVLAALNNPLALRYEPEPLGSETARGAVSEYYSARGDSVGIEDIVLTASTSEAYSYVFRTLCDPGEEVLIPAPSYPLFSFLADIQDVRLVRYPLFYDHGWQIDFHTLQQAITEQTRGVVVVNPNNPTGHFVSPADRDKLNEICGAYDMAIVADEVFLDFCVSKVSPLTMAGNSGALTFTMSGLSKISGLPQMKLAWVITGGPQDLKCHALERLEVIADTYLSVSTVVQLATPALLEMRRGFQKALMARIRRNLAELDRQIETHSNCSRLQVEGGWYAVLRVPATRSDEDAAVELLETKHVYVHPGRFYDFPSDGVFVVSLIAKEDEFADGIRRLLSRF
jgi:alanine-synthesizing transaminase